MNMTVSMTDAMANAFSEYCQEAEIQGTSLNTEQLLALVVKVGLEHVRKHGFTDCAAYYTPDHGLDLYKPVDSKRYHYNQYGSDRHSSDALAEVSRS